MIKKALLAMAAACAGAFCLGVQAQSAPNPESAELSFARLSDGDVAKLLNALPDFAKTLKDGGSGSDLSMASEKEGLYIDSSTKAMSALGDMDAAELDKLAKSKGYANGEDFSKKMNSMMLCYSVAKLEDAKAAVLEKSAKSSGIAKTKLQSQASSLDMPIKEIKKAVTPETFNAVKAKASEIDKVFDERFAKDKKKAGPQN